MTRGKGCQQCQRETDAARRLCRCRCRCRCKRGLSSWEGRCWNTHVLAPGWPLARTPAATAAGWPNPLSPRHPAAGDRMHGCACGGRRRRVCRAAPGGSPHCIAGRGLRLVRFKAAALGRLGTLPALLWAAARYSPAGRGAQLAEVERSRRRCRLQALLCAAASSSHLGNEQWRPQLLQVSAWVPVPATMSACCLQGRAVASEALKSLAGQCGKIWDRQGRREGRWGAPCGEAVARRVRSIKGVGGLSRRGSGGHRAPVGRPAMGNAVARSITQGQGWLAWRWNSGVGREGEARSRSAGSWSCDVSGDCCGVVSRASWEAPRAKQGRGMCSKRGSAGARAQQAKQGHGGRRRQAGRPQAWLCRTHHTCARASSREACPLGGAD